MSKGENITIIIYFCLFTIIYSRRINISDEKEFSQTFKYVFSNIVSNLKMPYPCNYFSGNNTHSSKTNKETLQNTREILVFSFQKNSKKGSEIYP